MKKLSTATSLKTELKKLPTTLPSTDLFSQVEKLCNVSPNTEMKELPNTSYPQWKRLLPTISPSMELSK